MVLTSFTSLVNEPTDEELIIGTWINEDDEKDKWVFTNNGNCKWYQDGELIDQFNYTIQRTSPQCGYQVRVPNDLEGVDYSYLRLKDTDEDQAIYCYEIFGVTQEGLSLNYLSPKVSLLIFDRQ